MKYSELSLEQKQKLAFTLLKDENSQQIFKNLSHIFNFSDEKAKGLDEEDETYVSPYEFINDSQKDSVLVKYKSLTFLIPKHIIKRHFNYGCILCAILNNLNNNVQNKPYDVSNMFDDLNTESKITENDFQTYVNFIINSDTLHSFSQFKDKDIQSYHKFKIFHNEFLNHMFMGGDYKYPQFLGEHDNMLYHKLNDLRTQIADFYKKKRGFPNLKNLCKLVYSESNIDQENNRVMMNFMTQSFMKEHRHYIAIEQYKRKRFVTLSRLSLNYSRDIKDYDSKYTIKKLNSIFDYYSITETKISPIYILKDILHNIINWNHWIIAGGFATTLILSSFMNMDNNDINDIDLFLINDDKKLDSKDILETTLTDINNYLNYVNRGRFNRSYLIRSKHAVTYFIHIPDSKKQLKYVQLQFILREYKQKEQVLLGFDIDSSCFYCNFDINKKLGIYATQRGLRSIYRGNIIDPSRQSSSYSQRLMKYYEKYSIPIVIPGLCLDTLQRSVDLNYSQSYRRDVSLDYVKSRNQNRFHVMKDIKTFELENNQKKICKQLYTLFRRTSNGIIGLLKLCFCTDTPVRLSLKTHKNKNNFIPPFLQQKNKHMYNPIDNNEYPQKWYTYLDKSTNTFIQLYLYYEAKNKQGTFRQFFTNVLNINNIDPDEYDSFNISNDDDLLPFAFHGLARKYRESPLINDFYFYKHFLISRNIKYIIDGHDTNIIISKCYELKENENIPSFQTKEIQFMSKNPGSQFTGSFNPTHSKIYNIHPMYYITHDDCKTKINMDNKFKIYYCYEEKRGEKGIVMKFKNKFYHIYLIPDWNCDGTYLLKRSCEWDLKVQIIADSDMHDIVSENDKLPCKQIITEFINIFEKDNKQNKDNGININIEPLSQSDIIEIKNYFKKEIKQKEIKREPKIKFHYCWSVYENDEDENDEDEKKKTKGLYITFNNQLYGIDLYHKDRYDLFSGIYNDEDDYFYLSSEPLEDKEHNENKTDCKDILTRFINILDGNEDNVEVDLNHFNTRDIEEIKEYLKGILKQNTTSSPQDNKQSETDNLD